MRQAGLWLAATALSASLVVGGPVIATAGAAPGGGHGHGGAGHSGAGHAGGAGGRGSPHPGPGSGPAPAAASPGGGRLNLGNPVTSGGGASSGVSTGGGPTNIGKGSGWSHGAAPPKPGQSAAAKPAQSPNNGGLPPSSSWVDANRAPVVGGAAGDGASLVSSGQARVTLPDSVAPTQTVAVSVAIARTMTISLDSTGDSRSSIDTQPLSMSVPGVIPVWWASDSEDLWNGFYGFAVLVLLPLVGVGLGLWLLAGLRRTAGGADSL